MVWQVVLLGLALSGTLSGSCLAGLELPFLCLIRAVCIGLASEPGLGRKVSIPILGLLDRQSLESAVARSM